MEFRDGRVQFTLRDMLVLFVIVALGLAVILPLIQQAREVSRRAQCISNMKRLGLAFHMHHDVQRKLPASCGVTRNPDGTIAALDGWSFLVHLLPFMDCAWLYDTLDLEGKPLVEPSGPGWSGMPHADAANTFLRGLRCPGNPNRVFVNPAASTGALTNYKAMGATHVESLMVASPKPTVPLYDPGGRHGMHRHGCFYRLGGEPVHPDGACFPGRELKFAAFGKDGTAHTILAVETIDPAYGIWTVGEECTLVGLPSQQIDEGGQWVPQEYKQYRDTYYAPAGFDAKYGDEATREIQRLKTYLGYDFRKAHPGPYVGGDPRNTYGPSSGHPGVVNHLFADGTVRSIARDEDFSTYMFHIARAGGDPTGCTYYDE